MCYNYEGITLLSLPGKVYSKVLERRIYSQWSNLAFRGTMLVLFGLWNTRAVFLVFARFPRIYRSSPNQSTCALWI